MDFDLKIYIPLVAASITSTVALIVGIINWRTNIKIRNQQLLVSNLEKDIQLLIEIRSLLSEDRRNVIPLIFPDLDGNIEGLKGRLIYISVPSLNKIHNNSALLKYFSIWTDISNIIKSISDVEDIVDKHQIITHCRNSFDRLIQLFDDEITLKNSQIKAFISK